MGGFKEAVLALVALTSLSFFSAVMSSSFYYGKREHGLGEVDMPPLVH